MATTSGTTAPPTAVARLKAIPKGLLIRLAILAALLCAVALFPPAKAAEPWVDLLNNLLTSLSRRRELEGLKIAVAVVGAALLFFGKRIYYFLVALPGAVLGFGIGHALDQGLGGIIGAVLGGLLAVFIHDLAIFLPGAILGTTLGAGLGIRDGAGLAISAVVMGAIFVALFRGLLILISSLLGALLVSLTLGNPGAGVWLVLTILGVLVQAGLFGWD